MTKKKELSGAVAKAIHLLLANDAFLLEHHANERSITHKLAEYLQQQLRAYQVDCEYSRHGEAVKRLPRHYDDRDIDRVYPDIVIHSRGTDQDNLLIIEAKLTWHPEAGVPEGDRIKLREFTNSYGEYRYLYGLFIGFSGLAEPILVWFKDGHEVEPDEYP